MNTAIKRAQTLAGDALEQAAQSGVARALASRRAAGVELTGADIDRVSGGLAFTEFTRAGGRPVDLGLVTNPAINPATNPALPAGLAQGALQNVGMVV